MTPLHICIPAWGLHYVDMATRYTIPAVLAALGDRKPTFVVFTDDRERFRKLLSGHRAVYRPVPAPGFPGLKSAHSESIRTAPDGAVVLLLNSDIVISREAFDVADALFTGQTRVIASLGVRGLIRDEQPPIGGTAAEVFAWAWRNKHPITHDCIWGSGRTSIPTTLYFQQHGNVVVRCFHLHPFFVRKDRPLEFRGTIDDDLLGRYTRSEIYVTRDIEIGFAELSPRTKKFMSLNPMTVDSVVQFGRRFIPPHVRNFGHTIRIVGDGPVDTTPADIIMARMENRKAAPVEAPYSSPVSRTPQRPSRLAIELKRLRATRQ